MIRGQKSIAEEVPKVSVPVEAKLHNRFDFEVIDSVTGKVKQRAYAENIILDKWWTRLATPAVSNGYIQVGTGTGTLAASRTSLFAFLAGKASTESVTTYNETENWVSHKRVATWLETENQNTAWTEVGIAHGITSTYLTTHALIKDLNGNPVTLNKGTTDIINVYSTIYAYLPAPSDGIRFTIPRNISLSGYNLIFWMLGLSTYLPLVSAYALKGDIQLSCVGNSSSSYVSAAHNPSGTSTASKSLDSATKKYTVAMARLPASSFNDVTGVKSIVLSPVYNSATDLQLTVPATWFPYSTVLAETIGTGDGSSLDFKTYFPFVKNDGSFVLKKNGSVVDSADYTVDYGEPNGSNLVPYLNVLDYYCSNYTIGIATNIVANAAQRALTYATFENPWHLKYGISSFNTDNYSDIYVSDSPTGPWTKITLSSGVVPAQYQNYRYWQVKPNSSSSGSLIANANSTALANAKNIHFAAGKAPAQGDIITADYRCEVVAKTANNVFDLTVEITLQEKVV